MKLYKLPNGTWVDPMTITAIHVVNNNPPIKFGATIVHGSPNSAYTFIEFNTLDEAVKFADDIGTMVNRRFQILLERKEVK